ncbi:PAS domain-containing protein [Mycolicibacterium baixiangningiae]|uniref:PAS domain-containing protein n=1 Tax=Mycolicibacterium baixiangningiae TaxID=2761578 RepID=UPI001866274F|nr:PAS domain-containing protein [Mycolicibacterium baixiangningiae]
MKHDWLLVEVLGDLPTVVAQGDRLRRFVPSEVFLRRNPHRRQIDQAIAAAVDGKAGIVQRTAHGNWLICADPVTMSDGRVHGVHVWTGPSATEPPDRPEVGATVWDLSSGLASDTRQALVNSGIDPTQPLDHRALADDLVVGSIHPEEGAALAAAVRWEAGQTLWGTWDIDDYLGNPIRVNFVSRATADRHSKGDIRHCIRAMNWRSPRAADHSSGFALAEQILRGTGREGSHRALLSLDSWTLLKWLDLPCPHFDWRGEHSSQPLVHPDDRPVRVAMTQQFVHGPAEGLLRLRSRSGWTLIHTTVSRVELAKDVVAGLISFRLPLPHDITADEGSGRV